MLDEVAAGSACETSAFKSIHALLDFNGPNHKTSMWASFALSLSDLFVFFLLVVKNRFADFCVMAVFSRQSDLLQPCYCQ